VTKETIESLKTNWKPVIIQLVNGQMIYVKHQDYLLASPKRDSIFVFEEPEGTRFVIIDVDKIVSIQRIQ